MVTVKYKDASAVTVTVYGETSGSCVTRGSNTTNGFVRVIKVVSFHEIKVLEHLELETPVKGEIRVHLKFFYEQRMLSVNEEWNF